jgi:hypothetical protein
VPPDASLLVTERITVQAEGEQIKRGIYRDLPVSYTLPLGLQKSGPINLLGVTRDGQSERLALSATVRGCVITLARRPAY